MVSALAELRGYEDEASSRLTAVRERLVKLNVLAREVPAIERRLADLRDKAGESPYRTQDVVEIERQLETARAARGERRRLRLDEASLLQTMEHTRRRLEDNGIRKISLPMLENVAIATPCDVSWADMNGDNDVRFCEHCRKDVYNLSMMARDEAEATLTAAKEKGLCVRLYRRDDGTVLTQDCPVGIEKQHRFWRRSRGIAAAGLLAAGLGWLAFEAMTTKCVVQESTAGAMTTMP
ncbi:MAG: hypothetical protein ACRELY_30750 [Polyangiaceae bacterium]